MAQLCQQGHRAQQSRSSVDSTRLLQSVKEECVPTAICKGVCKIGTPRSGHPTAVCVYRQQKKRAKKVQYEHEHAHERERDPTSPFPFPPVPPVPLQLVSVLAQAFAETVSPPLAVPFTWRGGRCSAATLRRGSVTMASASPKACCRPLTRRPLQRPMPIQRRFLQRPMPRRCPLQRRAAPGRPLPSRRPRLLQTRIHFICMESNKDAALRGEGEGEGGKGWGEGLQRGKGGGGGRCLARGARGSGPLSPGPPRSGPLRCWNQKAVKGIKMPPGVVFCATKMDPSYSQGLEGVPSSPGAGRRRCLFLAGEAAVPSAESSREICFSPACCFSPAFCSSRKVCWPAFCFSPGGQSQEVGAGWYQVGAEGQAHRQGYQKRSSNRYTVGKLGADGGGGRGLWSRRVGSDESHGREG